ncbi:hypothetical protein GIB67_026305 [Kingdonia uniflora]|uniref:C2H2-type domain-containing protein n=1 Tax=Kingdonia uniflora TaxID=39325 RepID=A0A7J7N5Q4_9MAGN|nr:hypothetical protein GIB67_026305 [Kingdonia uniflora]
MEFNFPHPMHLRANMVSRFDPMEEAIQRAIEKEEIRVREMMRRRELEAEVRRDLAMEGFPLSLPNQLVWSDHRVSPHFLHHQPNGYSLFSRRAELLAPSSSSSPFLLRRPDIATISPEAGRMSAEAQDGDVSNEIAEKKVAILVKPPISDVAGKKRKIIEIGGASGSLSMGVPKKNNPQKKWICALCQVITSCEQSLDDHYNGRKHKNKEALQRDVKIKATDIGSSSKPQSDKTEKPIMLGETGVGNARTRRFPFWCEDCNIGCNSRKVLNIHKKGRRHIAMISSTCGNEQSTVKDGNAESEVDGSEEVAETVKEVAITKESPEDVDDKVDGGGEVEEATKLFFGRQAEKGTRQVATTNEKFEYAEIEVDGGGVVTGETKEVATTNEDGEVDGGGGYVEKPTEEVATTNTNSKNADVEVDGGGVVAEATKEVATTMENPEHKGDEVDGGAEVETKELETTNENLENADDDGEVAEATEQVVETKGNAEDANGKADGGGEVPEATN